MHDFTDSVNRSRARHVFEQSDGKVTQAYYSDLNALGPAGQLAVALFRAQKTSTRAKIYRGRRYKSAAYDVKSWSMSEVSRILTAHALELGVTWGWKPDFTVVFDNEPSWVLYVDLPADFGQCSFHSPARGAGPAYSGEWDGARQSESRILRFCDAVEEGMNFLRAFTKQFLERIAACA